MAQPIVPLGLEKPRSLLIFSVGLYCQPAKIWKGDFMKVAVMSVSLAVLSGCAANAVRPEASSVEIVSEVPNKDRCKVLGEVYGSQGNWFTGDWTSNKNLMIGARNELRNEAHALGGNVVYIQDMKNTNAWGSLGTTNTTAVGKAYSCK